MSSTTGDQSQAAAPKKLRLITNQGAPHPKRRRVTAACLTCRKRKIACSGEQPTCQTCAQNKLECAGYNKQSGSNDTDDNNVVTPQSNSDRAQSSTASSDHGIITLRKVSHKLVHKREPTSFNNLVPSNVLRFPTSSTAHNTHRNMGIRIIPAGSASQQIGGKPHGTLCQRTRRDRLRVDRWWERR